MKLTIIYDNEVYKNGLTAEWGFSCLIEKNEHRILFDTGGDEGILLDNMKSLNISPNSFTDIFISHADWDHTGGLGEILKLNEKANLLIPSSCKDMNFNTSFSFIALSERPHTEIINKSTELYKDIYSTGELQRKENDKKEQSLIIKTNKGLVVVTGCSHPGVKNILEKAAGYANVYALIGGLHGFNEYDVLKDVDLICPTHCTQYQDEIISMYKIKCVKGGAGRVIEIN